MHSLLGPMDVLPRNCAYDDDDSHVLLWLDEGLVEKSVRPNFKAMKLQIKMQTCLDDFDCGMLL